jgi:hypothetical protein
VNTENEKVVRALFEQWWNDNCAYKTIFNYGYETIGQDIAYHAFKAALQSQVSNTSQDGKLRKALEDLLEQFDPRNHQSFCECDPSVGYQCAACKFPSIPAVIAAHEALATPPQQQEQSGEAVAPIGYIRLQNGKVDWDENCLSATEGGTLFGYEGIDSYTESPVYLESGQRVGSAALHTLLEYCERAEDCQMGTLAIDLVQRLVNEALSTSPTTPTATASQESAPTSDQTGREPS